jgi:hypothetical protein
MIKPHGMPKLKVAKNWNYRMIIISSRGVVDWDDYKYPDHLIFASKLMMQRVVALERAHER